MPTNIEWSDETWNPTTGCTKVSNGCKNCYAESLTKRYAGANGWPAEFKPWTPANAAENVVLHPDRLEAPLHWKKPRRIFVNSMSDLFHEDVPDDYIDRVFAVMALTPQHTYQVLTKRPERMREYLRDSYFRAEMVGIDSESHSGLDRYLLSGEHRWPFPLPNVWLGVTVENQRWADERIPILLDTPAAVRFLSCEPLLGPVDLRETPAPATWTPVNGATRDDLKGCLPRWQTYPMRARLSQGVDWVIVGGESGPRHRHFDPDWARSIVAQCREAEVACFVKQLGGARPGNKLEDLPLDLQVRQFPR